MLDRPATTPITKASTTSSASPVPEQAAWLGLIPVLATFCYYLLPRSVGQLAVVQFVPQLVAYGAFLWWAQRNGSMVARLGLERAKLPEGLRQGSFIGLVLGMVNVAVILWLIPRLGRDITFLQHTPHAKIPTWIMLPWFILFIALFVEVNFRGFQLGRLLRLARGLCPTRAQELATPLALLVAATTFAFDPFMVATFRHLHWIALWDGLIWGTIWLRRRNLYTTIVAHAVEVVMLYAVVRYWLER